MSGDYIHFDHGVRVSRQPDSRGSHRIRWTDPHTQAAQDARRKEFEDARKFAQDLVTLLGEPLPAKTGHQGRTFGDLVEFWLDPAPRGAVLTESSLRNYRSLARHWFLPSVGAETLCSSLNRDHCTELMGSMQAKLAEQTVRTRWNTFVSVLRLGVDHGFMTQNPASGIRPPRRRVQQSQSSDWVEPDTIPTHDAVSSIMDRLQQFGCGLDLCVLLGAYSGLRLGEVLGLRASDVDLPQRLVRVERQWTSQPPHGFPAPKYDKVRQTILLDNPSLRTHARFAEHIEDCTAVGGPDAQLFLGQGDKPRSHASVRTRYNAEARSLGWEVVQTKGGTTRLKWTFHSLRHLFCTWALNELCLDPADVSHFAGHASTQLTLDRYVARRAGALDRASAANAKWLATRVA